MWIAAYAFVQIIGYVSILMYIPAGQIMQQISTNITLFGFAHYLKLPESWHEERASGEKLQRLTTAKKESFEFLESIFWYMLVIPALLVIIPVSLIALNAPWYYSALYAALITLYIAASFITNGWLRTRFVAGHKALEAVIGGVYEFIVSTATVRLFGLKPHVMRMGEALEADYLAERKKLFITVCKRWLVHDFMGFVFTFGILALATYEVIWGGLALSAYTAILFFSLTLWGELERFNINLRTLLQNWVGFERIVEIFNEHPAIQDAPDAETLSAPQADLHFDGLTFHYNENKGLIRDFNLQIKAGEKIGILGPSGAGRARWSSY